MAEMNFGHLSPEVINAIEEEGWIIVSCEKRDFDYILTLGSCSDLGEDLQEDFWFNGCDEDLLDAMIRCYQNFDVDEHAEMWIPNRGQYGIPDSISALVEDAEGIQQMLEDLADAVGKAMRDNIRESV